MTKKRYTNTKNRHIKHKITHTDKKQTQLGKNWIVIKKKKNTVTKPERQ